MPYSNNSGNSLFNLIKSEYTMDPVNYNLQESPSTQQYHSVAAQNNPDYAQVIGDLYRFGDINRANFNLGLDLLFSGKRNQYLEQKEQERRKWAEDLADKNYNRQRQAQLEDRNRQELSYILSQPQVDYISGAKDWQGNVNPEQQKIVSTHNKLADKVNNSKDIISYLRSLRNYEQYRNNMMFNPQAKPAQVDNINQQEYIYGDDNTAKNSLYQNPVLRFIANLFGISNKESDAIVDRNKKLAEDSTNIFNEGQKDAGFLDKLFRNFGYDGGIHNVEQLMRNKSVGMLDWSTNNNTVNIANQLMNTPIYANTLGDIRNYALLGDLTDSSGNNFYIVNKETKQLIKLIIRNGRIVDLGFLDEGDI